MIRPDVLQRAKDLLMKGSIDASHLTAEELEALREWQLKSPRRSAEIAISNHQGVRADIVNAVKRELLATSEASVTHLNDEELKEVSEWIRKSLGLSASIKMSDKP